MAQKMRVGVKAAIIGGVFIVLAAIITGLLSNNHVNNTEPQVQKTGEQKVDTGSINNYNVRGDIKIENNNYSNSDIHKLDNLKNKPRNDKSKVIDENKNKSQTEKDTSKIGAKYVFNESVDNRGGAIGDNNTVNNYGRPQRVLDNGMLYTIASFNRKMEPFKIWYFEGDPETRSFANQIENGLKKLGFKVIENTSFLTIGVPFPNPRVQLDTTRFLISIYPQD